MRNCPGQFQLHDDHIDQRSHRWPPRFHHEMGCFSVQWIAISVQLTQATQGVGNLQKRPIDVMAQPAEQLVGIGLEVDHVPALPQMLAVGAAYDCAAPGRQNPRRFQGQGVHRFFFDVTKTGFPLSFEKLPYRTAKTLLYGMVGVDKGDLQPPGQLASDGCFA